MRREPGAPLFPRLRLPVFNTLVRSTLVPGKAKNAMPPPPPVWFSPTLIVPLAWYCVLTAVCPAETPTCKNLVSSSIHGRPDIRPIPSHPVSPDPLLRLLLPAALTEVEAADQAPTGSV